MNQPDLDPFSIAELSNSGSVVVVAACLIFLVIYLISVRTEESAMAHTVTVGIPKQLVRDVKNPFKLGLVPGKASSILEGVWLQLTSQVDFQMQLLWGVSIEALYPAIFKPWDSFIQCLESGKLLENHCLHQADISRQKACRDTELHCCTADGRTLSLGDKPRAVYPLVVVMTLPAEEIQWDNQDIVAMISVLHLSDDVCPGKSHIICQYVRTTTGDLHNLEQLYVTSSDPDAATVQSSPDMTAQPAIPDCHRQQWSVVEGDASPSESDISSSGEAEAPAPPRNLLESGGDRSSCIATEETRTEETDMDCIVCACDGAVVVLLPCRHTCVCRECLRRLDKCPMCRSYIESYFTLDGTQSEAETHHPQPPNTDDDDNPANSPQWWVNLNRRINHVLGFS